MLVELTADERTTNQMLAMNLTADGNTEEINVGGFNTVGVQITGVLGGGKITFQGSLGGGEWFNILGTNVTSGTASVDGAALGIYRVNCSGIKLIRGVLSSAAAKDTQVEATDYNIVDATGVVTFIAGHIPADKTEIRADYKYSVAVAEESIGVGDAIEDTFTIGEIVAASETIKVDGVTKTRTTHYAITNGTGEIVFVTEEIPAAGLVVTASYTSVIPVVEESLGYSDGVEVTYTVANLPVVSQDINVYGTVVNAKAVMTN